MTAASTISEIGEAFRNAAAPVRQFATEHVLSDTIDDIMQLALKVFDLVGPVTLSLQEDPDTAERWIEVGVRARGSIEKIMRDHDRYTEQMLALPNASPRLIRLFLQVASD